MDPNATLTHLRANAQYVLDRLSCGDMIDSETLEDMANQVQNLDRWIRNGGFLPTDWNKNNERDNDS